MKKSIFGLAGNILTVIAITALMISCKKQAEIKTEEKSGLGLSKRKSDLPAIANNSNLRKVGYLNIWYLGNEDYAAYMDSFVTSQYTDIIIGFAPNTSGNYVATPSVTQAITIAHNAGIRVFFCIGTADSNSPANVQINTNRPAYISMIRKFLTDNNFDGIDLDFEGGGLTTNFSPFLVQLSDSLSLHSKKLSIAIAKYQANSVSTAAYGRLDFVNVMCYDYGSTAPGPDASFSQFVTDFNTFKTKVPASKINMGIPFYGYRHQNGVSGQVGYSNIIAEIPSAASVNYIAVSGKQYFYDGFPVLRRKIPFVLQEGCGGIMVWHIMSDTRDDATSLIKFINYCAANPDRLGFDTNIKFGVQNLNSGKNINVAGASSTNGANLVQDAAGNSLSQKWTIVHLGNGEFGFINHNSGQMMSIYGGSMSNGANLVQWPWGSSTNQKFTLVPDDFGYYKITAVNSGQAVSVYGGALSDGANIVQWPWGNSANQKWIITR